MTLALIAVLVFLVVWWYQSGKNKELQQKHIRESITNIPLQKELFCKWFYKISEEMNKENPDDKNLYDFIKGYYLRYNIPPFNVTDTIAEREKKEYDCKLETKKYTYDWLRYRCFNTDFLLYTKETLQERLNEIDKFDGDFAIFLGRIDFRTYRDSSEFQAVIRYKLFEDYLTSYQWSSKGGIIIKDVPPHMVAFHIKEHAPSLTNTQKIICSGSTLFFFFMGLIQGLTTRELKEQGFNYSPTWEESYRQYAEQRHETIEENKKNYPWLFN